MMGDFNTRLYANMVQGLPEHIGKTLFSPSVDDELSDSNNLHFFIDFLLETNLCVVSTMRPRPAFKLVTYQEISHDPPPPTSPTLDTYSVLDPYSAAYLVCHTYSFPGTTATIFLKPK